MRNNKAISSTLPPAILIGGAVIALSAARSLGRAGVKVYSLDWPTSEARYSRFSTWIPLDYSNGNAHKVWLDWLLGEGARFHQGAVLFPCSDEGLDLVVKHHAELKRHFTIIEMNDAVHRSMLDKSATYKLAESIGVPAPRVWEVNTRADIQKIVGTLLYPCALKPRSSHEFVKHFPSLKMFIVNDEAELIRVFTLVQEHKLEMLVTELIPPGSDGYHSYYSYLDEQGNPLFHFTKLKLRQHPNAFGLGTYHVTNWNPEVAALGLRFFQGVGIRGLGNVEFMRDPRDGQLKFIECNARLTLTTELVHASGIDLPLLTYNRVTGRPLPSMEKYRTNVYAIRPMGDILAALEMRGRGEMTLVQWIRSLMHIQHFLVFQWRDPLPALCKMLPFIGRQSKKLLPRTAFSQKGNAGAVESVYRSRVNKGSV